MLCRCVFRGQLYGESQYLLTQSEQSAATETAKITGGKLDYIIGNAGIASKWDGFDGFRGLADRPEELTKTMRELNEVNVIGNIHLFNVFVPLLLKGDAKKAVAITSGFADTALTNDYDIAVAPLYSASKAAVNMIVAKFSAEYKQDGLLFLALCPGMVDVGHYANGMLFSSLRFSPRYLAHRLTLFTGSNRGAAAKDGRSGAKVYGLSLRAERGETPVPMGPPVRLAWPKTNDTRRSVVGKSPPLRKARNGKNGSDLFIVSVSQRDMEMHCSTTDLTLDGPLRWFPQEIHVGERELLQHFQLAASKALAILGHDPAQLGNALIRVALASNTASAGALLKSLLAFSSLHRHDVHAQAVELKVEAIEALGAASRSTCSDVEIPEAIQHVATGMLLCTFEVRTPLTPDP